MLRSLHASRLAPLHSPFREQRELYISVGNNNLFESTPDPDENEKIVSDMKDANKKALEGIKKGNAAARESLDAMTGGDTNTDQNTRERIAKVQKETATRSIFTVPNITNIPERARLLDTAWQYGSTELSQAIEKRAKAKRINMESDNDSPIDKSDIFYELMKEPKFALEISKILDMRMKRQEELMTLVESSLKRIADRNKREAINDIAQLQSFLQKAKDASPGDREALRQKIMELLGLNALEDIVLSDGSQDQILNMLEVMESGLQAGFKLNTFIGKNAGTNMAEAREKYLAELKEQYEGTVKCLEAGLQYEANDVWQESSKVHNVFSNKTNKEMMKGTGMTARGFINAFAKSIQCISNVARNNEGEKASSNLVEPTNPAYLSQADEALKQLARAKSELKAAHRLPNDTEGYDGEPIFMRNERVREKQCEEMGYEIGEEIQDQIKDFTERKAASEARGEANPGADKALEYLEGQNAIFGEFANRTGTKGTASLDAITQMRRMPIDKLGTVRETLKALRNDPNILLRIQETEKNRQDAAMNNTERMRAQLREKLKTVIPSLMDNLTSDVFDEDGLDVVKQLKQLERHIDVNLDTAGDARLNSEETIHDADGKEKKPQSQNEAFANAQTMINELEKAKPLLERIHSDGPDVIEYKTGEEFAAIGEAETAGYYDDKLQKIFINTTKCSTEAEKKATIEHERAHAVIDILTRKTNTFPHLFAELRERVKNHAKEMGMGLDELRSRLANVWGYTANDAMSEADFLDELVVQYVDWKKGRNPAPSEDEDKLFALFKDSGPLAAEESEKEKMSLSAGGEDTKKRRMRKAMRNSVTGVSEDEEEKGVVERDFMQELHDVESNMQRFKSFFTVYPERRNDEGVENHLNEIGNRYAAAKKALEAGATKETLEPLLDDVNGYVSELAGEIKRIDALKMDLANAAPSQIIGWRKIVGNVSWVSIYDIGSMFTDAKEDIMRMWKRRAEQARSAVGRDLFGIIPRTLPYVGQLEREFEGREQSSEQEEVGVWEKRYETLDAHTLLHTMLPKSTNKDELKAIINLLTKAGRMDWNDHHLWEKLESMSIYHMPNMACMRDILLRDMYLQKLIANIWKDKDKFEHWKNHNDSAINSGKSHHQATTDTLSGSKGLEAKLTYLLDKKIQENNGVVLPNEEEINPHLYEQVLHYSMTNGKMAFEDKFFFLIQGVAQKMLNIDRMKALLGEQGEILGTFPCIDFFNGKTYPDIIEMAKKLGYPTATAYDVRTTEFLLNDVRKDSGARKRVQKGLKKANEWDHEDLPQNITMLDTNGIDQLIAINSGQQWKVTMEGMKNIYVGYNTFLQHFAIKAKLAREKGKSFSNADLRQLAVGLAAYAHYDNKVTLPAKQSERPTLSFNQINSEPPVSGSVVTKKYRDTANDFLASVVEACNIPETNGVPMSTFLGKDRDETSASKIGAQDKLLLATPGIFTAQLESAVLGNKDKIMDLLVSMASKSADQGGFRPENSKYTYENVAATVA